MAVATDHVTTTFDPGAEGTRREEREETIRIVEYSSFPRVPPQQHLRLGFTRDLSSKGMCLGADEREPVGSLLRLCIRDISGRCAEAFVGRVVWASPERDGRFWIGLELLTKALTMGLAVRRTRDEESEAAANRMRA
jgi:hypothetical protein